MTTRRITVPVTEISGTASAGTVRVRFPTGVRYHSVHLNYDTLASLGDMRLLLNGRPIQRFTAAQLNDFNVAHGIPVAPALSGILSLFFDEPWLKLQEMVEMTALNTGRGSNPQPGGAYINEMVLEIDTSAPVTLSCFAEQSDRLAGDAGLVVHRRSRILNAAGAGVLTIRDDARGQVTTAALRRLYLKPDANDISNLEIWMNNFKVVDRSKALNEHIQKALGRITPVAGTFIYDRAEGGVGADPLNLADTVNGDFYINATMSGAANVTVISDYLGELGDS